MNGVIGQEEVKARLAAEIRSGRIPHALLLSGPPGCGKLALALACARMLLCSDPEGDRACGTCKPCRMMDGYVHPDLHFVFPVIRKGSTESSVSDVFLEAWRKRLLHSPYFDMDDWLADMKAENQQAVIYTAEAARIQNKLSLKSTMGGRKVMVIWKPEKMMAECANKLLKLIEEPPADTVFLLVSDEADKILPTIQSRTQRIEVKALDTATIAEALQRLHGLDEETARLTARAAHGSYTAALKALAADQDRALFFDLFVLLMRLSYARRIKEMRKWSEQLASMGRERQKNFLGYCQRLIRENFIYNFRAPELNYMNAQENEFATKFARFVNERNVMGIMHELEEAELDIEQNANPKMVFFDFALKMIVLLIQ